MDAPSIKNERVNRTCAPSIYELNNSILPDHSGTRFQNDIDEATGRLVQICINDNKRSKVNLGSFVHWMKPAILHNQILFLQSSNARTENGYITWAWVNDETLHRYLNVSGFFLHPSEWNEGLNLIVIDFYITGNSIPLLKECYRKAKALGKEGAKSINICIRDDFGTPIKKHKVLVNNA